MNFGVDQLPDIAIPHKDLKNLDTLGSEKMFVQQEFPWTSTRLMVGFTGG